MSLIYPLLVMGNSLMTMDLQWFGLLCVGFLQRLEILLEI